MRTLHHKILAGAAALLWLASLPAHGAVTVYSINLTQQALRLNPAVFVAINGAALAPTGTTGGLFAGDGFLSVEGNRVEYYLAMSWLDSLPSLSFESAIAAAQLLLGTPQRYDRTVGTPSLSGYMTVIGLDGTVEQHPIYIGNQGIDTRYVYSGSVVDPALAALLADAASGLMVYADSDAGTYRPSGTLMFTPTPEPSRAFLLIVGAFTVFCRRRRALGSG